MINEWENEPNYLRFTEDTTGWECIIKRHRELGILCGYVVIPKDSVLYNKHYNDELFNNIKVHGGLTYSEHNKDEYLIGFDCAHLDDLAPYKQDIYQGTYKNIAYVEYECFRLARQLYELSNTKSNTGGKNMTYTHEMIDQALMNLLDDIIVKVTLYKNNIKNKEYHDCNGILHQLKDGEYFNTLGAKATIQCLIDSMVECEHKRKYGVKKMIDKDEILDECEDKINNLESCMFDYIDKCFREIRVRLEKLERFSGIIGNGADEKHNRELEQLLVEIDLEQ